MPAWVTFLLWPSWRWRTRNRPGVNPGDGGGDGDGYGDGDSDGDGGDGDSDGDSGDGNEKEMGNYPLTIRDKVIETNKVKVCAMRMLPLFCQP